MSDPVTLNVYVTDTLGNGIPDARVTILTRNQIIDPPVRQTSGDGGANLYYRGPAFTPPIPVTILVDAAGFRPYSTADTPVQLGATSIDHRVVLTPFV